VEKREFRGRILPLVSREDLLVMKALAFGEQTPSYWHEALGIIARGELDWDYVLYRARHGMRRVLSLLVDAQSNDLHVPPRAVLPEAEVHNETTRPPMAEADREDLP